MGASGLAIVEMVLTFGGIFGFGLWELSKLRREARRKGAAQGPGAAGGGARTDAGPPAAGEPR